MHITTQDLDIGIRRIGRCHDRSLTALKLDVALSGSACAVSGGKVSRQELILVVQGGIAHQAGEPSSGGWNQRLGAYTVARAKDSLSVNISGSGEVGYSALQVKSVGNMVPGSLNGRGNL